METTAPQAVSGRVKVRPGSASPTPSGISRCVRLVLALLEAVTRTVSAVGRKRPRLFVGGLAVSGDSHVREAVAPTRVILENEARVQVVSLGAVTVAAPTLHGSRGRRVKMVAAWAVCRGMRRVRVAIRPVTNPRAATGRVQVSHMQRCPIYRPISRVAKGSIAPSRPVARQMATAGLALDYCGLARR